VLGDYVIDQNSVSIDSKYFEYGSIIPLTEITNFAKVKYQNTDDYINYYDGFIPHRELSLQIRSRNVNTEFGDNVILTPTLVYQ
jgi:hypothetical protein